VAIWVRYLRSALNDVSLPCILKKSYRYFGRENAMSEVKGWDIVSLLWRGLT
jgi:hypothetical protein